MVPAGQAGARLETVSQWERSVSPAAALQENRSRVVITGIGVCIIAATTKLDPNGVAHMPRPVQYFMLVSIILCGICGFVEVFCRFGLHHSYPYTWPLLATNSRFTDLTGFRSRFVLFHGIGFFSFQGPEFLYPAPLAVVYRFWYHFSFFLQLFLASFLVSFLGAACLFGRTLLAHGLPAQRVLMLLIASVACSYPMFFEIEQANVEWIVWLIVICGLWAFLRGSGYTAAACFGIAGAMKIFPLIFLGLLLARRRVSQVAVGLIASGLITAVSLWLVCPNMKIAWEGTQHGLDLFRHIYILHYTHLEADHSLFGLAKAILRPKLPALEGAELTTFSLPLPPVSSLVTHLLAVYMPLMAVLGILLYCTRIFRLPVVNQIIFLTTASIMLPPVSYDYTLLHLYAPCALLVLVAVDNRERETPGLSAGLLCFAVLFSPETEVIFHGRSYGGQIKALFLFVLMIVVLRYRFPSSYDDTEAVYLPEQSR